jgi:hypothetical protein
MVNFSILFSPSACTMISSMAVRKIGRIVFGIIAIAVIFLLLRFLGFVPAKWRMAREFGTNCVS